MPIKQSELAPVRGWFQSRDLDTSQLWVCAYCGERVSSRRGYSATPAEDGGGPGIAFIYICSHCRAPTFFLSGGHSPDAPSGSPVSAVPEQLSALYDEARRACGAGAYTSAVLTCRKMLMHIAVEKDAAPGNNFVYYVEYLASNHYVPPDGKTWVDYVRVRGNEANHEIVIMAPEDAEGLITLVGALLRFIYELPALVPTLPSAAAPTTPTTK